MAEHSPTPWRVIKAYDDEPARIIDADDDEVAVELIDADASLIVEAVNERDRLRKEILDLKCERDQLREIVDRYERERMELCHKIGRREKDLSETANERDRVRDLVRRLYLIVKDANEFATSMASMFQEQGDRRAWHEMESILREAREALAEGLQEGDGKC